MTALLLQSDPTEAAQAITTFIRTVMPFFWAYALLLIISQWIIFRKAGYQGWESIIPIYSYLVLLKIVGKPWWWIFLVFLIPVFGIGLIWIIWTLNMLSKSFGKDEGFTVGLFFLGFIFYPVLAFGKAEYKGPYGDKAAYDAFQASKHSFDFEQK